MKASIDYVVQQVGTKQDLFTVAEPLAYLTAPGVPPVLTVDTYTTDDVDEMFQTVAESLSNKANATDLTTLSTAVASKAESSALTALANSVPTQINAEIAALVGTAPQTLNTLQELASAINNDQNYAATIQTQPGNKANKSDVYTITQADGKFYDKSR